MDTRPQEQSSSSWWGWSDGLLQTVKKQSENIIAIYKEDLSEFTRTIKEDTLNVVKDVVQVSGSSSTTTAANTSKSGRSKQTSSGFSNFFNFMENLNDDDEEILTRSRIEKAVKKLQKNPETFAKEPEDEADFIKWKADFNLETKTADISQLLSTNPKLRAVHNELLPKLTYSVFWERYYYRLQKLIKEEERRDKILIRAELESQLEDWGGWEDDDEAPEEVVTNVEPSPATQLTVENEDESVLAESPKNAFDPTNNNVVALDSQADKEEEKEDLALPREDQELAGVQLEGEDDWGAWE